MLKKIRFYQINKGSNLNIPEFLEALKDYAFQKCTPSQEQSVGWDSVYPSHHPLHGEFITTVGDFVYCQLRIQEKHLPNAAILDQFEEELQILRTRLNSEPSKKEKRSLKEEVKSKLIPKALPKSSYIPVCIHPSTQKLYVGSLNENHNTLLLTYLHQTYPKINCSLIKSENKTNQFLNNLLINRDKIREFQAQKTVVLQEVQGKGKIAIHSIDLDSPEIRQYLVSGMQIKRLEIRWKDDLTLHLHNTGEISQIQWTEEAKDSFNDPETNDFDADLFLSSSLLKACLDDLSETIFE